MQEYLAITRALAVKFQYFQICHVPREDNMAADALVRLTSFSEAPLEPTLIGHQFEPSKLDVGATNVNCASTESNWMSLIRAFIQEGTLLDNPLEAKKLRMRASKFTIL